MKKIFIAGIFTLFATNLIGKVNPYSTVLNESKPASTAGYRTQVPISFIENKGQVTDQNSISRDDIQFKVAAGPGLNIFIGNGAIHYQFSKPDEVAGAVNSVGVTGFSDARHSANTYTMYRMDVELIGANRNALVIKSEQKDYYENHFIASAAGYAVAGSFSKVVYKDIYPNIDWVLYTVNGQLKHEFLIHAGGNVSDIKLKYGGAVSLDLSIDGKLVATTPDGVVTEDAPVSYQADGKTIASSFRLDGDVLSYNVGSYTGSLVIDPVLIWGTYYGGSGSEDALCTATDNAGNVYICGYTSSASSIATTGAYQTTYGGSTDAYLAKFSKSGSLLWATYYGGSSDDYGRAVSTDASGNVYMAGSTSSSSAIATSGAYQTTYLGGDDAFIVKFNAAGAIQWGTYYGGTNSDYAFGMAIDVSGNVCITGQTMSSSGIATSGSFRTYVSGSYDGFLAKFDGTGAIQWGTYYGGSSADYGYGVATDAAGNIYIDGYTASASTMTTTGAYQTVLDGIYDAYLAKFNSAGTIQWATYFGGDNADIGYGLAVTGAGDVYLAGYTYSTTSLATTGAYQTVYGGGSDAFLAKFDNAGSLQWATYYGGSALDEAHSVGIGAAGDVYITGMTQSTAAIATTGAHQPVFGGGIDAFLAQFTSAGALGWATYYGGSSNESAKFLSVGDSQNVYISGYTQSTTAMATSGAYQTTLGGGTDAFLARFNFCSMPVAGTVSGSSSVCMGNSITLTAATPGGVWSSSNPAVATVGSTGTVTGIMAGVDTISYAMTNLCGTDYAYKIVTVISCGTEVETVSDRADNVALYPNPAHNTLTITSTGNINSIVVTDLFGRVVASGVYDTKMVVMDISRLSNGIYMVRVNNDKIYKVIRQ